MGDLFGDDAPVKTNGRRARKPKVAEQSDGAVRRCFDAWYNCYLAKWRMTPKHLEPGRAGRDFKALVAAYGEAETLALIERFFATAAWQVVRGGYTVGEFYRAAPALSLEGLKPADERTAGNLDAASRATRRRQ